MDRDPFLALQPPLATALADRVEACAGYIPAFGSVKPLIKDHKMKIPLSQWLEQWTLQSSEILPLRLVHKATVGPSQPIASLISPVLEALAAVCTCALGQAANDIVRFCAEHAFSFCPAIATMDVTDAFWKMQERTIMRRTKAVADDNPAILEFFVVSWETLELALHVILQDNFFVAPAFSSAAIYGRFTGCTMGNVVSKPLCEIYYFGAFKEALARLPSLTVFYIRAGGDDSVIMAHSDEDICILHAEMLNADDGWSFELKMMERDQPLSFFDVELRRCLDSNSGLWIVHTGVHFKPTDALLRTHADSFWPRAHQDALLRSHLLRITRLCSTRETVTQAARTVGRLLARRRHPLEDLIDSLRQLEPQFLCDMIPPRHVCDSRGSFLEPWYRPFVPPRPKEAPKLLIKMPFIGPASTVLRRVILETWTGIERFRLSRDDVCITFIPFKCLSRLLPGAKRHPSPLLFGNAVYMIRDSVSSCEET